MIFKKKSKKKTSSGFSSKSSTSSSASQSSRKIRKRPLDKLRKQLSILTARANEIVARLRDSEAMDGSAAYYEAIRTVRPSHREAVESGEEELFTSEQENFRALKREFARVEKFLSSPDIQPRVADYQKARIEAARKHGLSFHAQGEMLSKYGRRFLGDEELLKIAFKAYRDVEEYSTSIYYGQFGSDNLINLIYDALENYNPNFQNNMSDEEVAEAMREHAREIAKAALDEYDRNVLMGFIEGTPNVNVEGQLVSSIAKAKNAKQVLEENPWLLKYDEKDNIS